MPRLNVVTPAGATGKTKELYDAITRAAGGVPNIYQGVGNSAPALGALLGVGEALKQGQLTLAESEAIKLVVSEAYGCTYCLAAHTFLGKKAGLTEADTVGIRRGTAADPRLDALVTFVRAAIQPAARLSDGDLAAMRSAGFSDAQVTDVLMVVAQTVFTNLFNRVHQTPLDFPAAPAL